MPSREHNIRAILYHATRICPHRYISGDFQTHSSVRRLCFCVGVQKVERCCRRVFISARILAKSRKEMAITTKKVSDELSKHRTRFHLPIFDEEGHWLDESIRQKMRLLDIQLSLLIAEHLLAVLQRESECQMNHGMYWGKSEEAPPPITVQCLQWVCDECSEHQKQKCHSCGYLICAGCGGYSCNRGCDEVVYTCNNCDRATFVVSSDSDLSIRVNK